MRASRQPCQPGRSAYRSIYSARHRRRSVRPRPGHLTAAVCAFSVTSRITQRDGSAGRGHARKPHLAAPPATGNALAVSAVGFRGLTTCQSLACWMIPGLAPFRPPKSPRSPSIRSAARPSRSRPRVPAASVRPGRGSHSPLRRNPRSALPGGRRAPCGMHDGRGCQRHGNPGRPDHLHIKQMRMTANMRTWLIFDLPHPTPVQPAGVDNAPQHMQFARLSGRRRSTGPWRLELAAGTPL
jgi:hypothetical protein